MVARLLSVGLVFLSVCSAFARMACSGKRPEASATPHAVATPHPASNYTVEIKKEDLEYIATLTDTLMSGDRKRILQAYTELPQKSNAGLHLGLIINTVMKKGTPDQRVLVDNLVTAVCKVAEGSETTELNAHPLLVGITQTAFEAAGERGPGSIPPLKNVLEWWKSSKPRSLLLVK